MRVHLLSVCAAALLGAAAILDASAPRPLQQSSPAPFPKLSDGSNRVVTKHVIVRTSVEPAAAKAKGRVEIVVEVTPREKMHVYAPGQEGVIPVALTIPAGDGYRVLPAVYPQAEKYFFAPLKETQLVYSQPFRIRQPLAIVAAAERTLTVTGMLRYQACDDSICYLPQNVPLSWTVAVER